MVVLLLKGKQHGEFSKLDEALGLLTSGVLGGDRSP